MLNREGGLLQKLTSTEWGVGGLLQKGLTREGGLNILLQYLLNISKVKLENQAFALPNSFLNGTVEPRFNKPQYNEVLGITNDILQPGQSYSKMYGIEPRYNEPRYNEILVTTNTIEDPKCKIYSI